MPHGAPKKPFDGQLHDVKSRCWGKVNTFGQIALRFHSNPTNLENWFQQNSLADQSARSSSDSTLVETKSCLPTPRLNIAIQICGSRGDVQPFIPIAKILQAPPYGHRVRICTHPVFKDFVEGNGIEFFSIGGDPEALMAYMVKNPGLLPSMESLKAGDIAKRRKEMGEMVQSTWRSCIEAGNGMGPPITAINVDNPEDLFIADVIIANPPSMGHIHCAEKLGIPLHMVFTMPWSPTKAFHHPLAAMDYGDVDHRTANYFSFAMMELLTWQGLGDLINKFRTHTLKLDPISPMWGFQLVQRLKVPYSYLWSQTLIPKPEDWPSHISVTGFSFLKAGRNYTPPPDLVQFLESGPPPVYIGFGSIVVDKPSELTKLLFEAVALAGVRAIISKGWGGFEADQVPDNIYLIGNCPHDWLFQRVSCVVHHGGAGTTAAGIALGKPTVVVPFFGDQPFWGQMIARAGAGPKPIPYKLMTAESLADSIRFALRDDVRVSCERMAADIAEEDGATDTVKAFEQHLKIDDMRCQVCPGRLAVWLDKKTGVHLSNMAVCTLAEKGLVHPKELRLLRHKNWYVHEGAESPLIGAVAAMSGTFASIATATSDYSERLKRPNKPADSTSQLPRKRQDEEAIDQLTGIPRPNPTQLETMAWRMALKTYEANVHDNFEKPPENSKLAKMRARIAEKKARRGRAHQIVCATAHYGKDLTKTGLQAPVAFFYNVANGFRNFPSYVLRNEMNRRRDEITGLGTGLTVAGRECILGFYEAFAGVLCHPYMAARQEGAIGVPKGLGRSLSSFSCHILAGVFAVPGYTLKGIEAALSKHSTTDLQAELYLIRLRQAIHDKSQTTQEERAEVVEKWKNLQGLAA
ncbi:similar to glycosyltransferase family 28 N-terminal domain protein [Plenodomus lingam JN3]|uniref:Similar to glycosyltransferase family 28 N-terminal domain protein n=1 Tax=Leptosphaeria maculans (strain JN3 / isolate v23.1.3 / race Av1-4-5-6-7-8) TaxID=985895 RepID=E5AAG3_LEPMJ|nr:similar to glycosyltransferase family 28 N-terminal domain protein [Plenodomus lingam JN3]CBY00654.1 similar to glycosyltransferase family 28 N-terminal domain protein [Plenodomus lingam JN3]